MVLSNHLGKWFLKFSTTLIQFGFEKCHSDHTLFVRAVDGKFLVVIVYVDDIIVASTDDGSVIELKQMLSNAFQLRDFGPPKYFFGTEIARLEAGISLTQRKYVMDLLTSAYLSAALCPSHKQSESLVFLIGLGFVLQLDSGLIFNSIVGLICFMDLLF